MNWKRVWKRREGRSLNSGAGGVLGGLMSRFSYILKSVDWGRLSRAEKSKLLAKISRIFFIGVLGTSIIGVVTFAVVARELPDPGKIVRKDGFSTKILDRNGLVLFDVFANQKRIPVKLSEVPKVLQEATIAIEDKNFYKHEGFDPMGWVRSIYRIVVRRQLSGGSTLTQQLVKNVLLTPQRTVWRKIKEFILAVQIERKFSKEEILVMYLNEAPYGGTAWGVEAAAETYYGKRVSELNLVESAILAGLPQRPSVYSPFSPQGGAYYKGRTKDVLRRMREDGYITSEDEEKAIADLDSVKFSSDRGQIKAPHFVFYVKDLLEKRYGEKLTEQGGLTVTTSLDLALQEEAQKIVKEEIEKVKKQNINNGAAVVMDPVTGEILSMVGSRDYDDPDYDGKYNVTTALRQPGSAIKPVTYVTALMKGYTASTMVMDVLTTFPGGEALPEYKPANYDGKYRGPVQLRYALGNSLNIPAVKLLATTGVKDVLNTAYEMGINSLEPTAENTSRLGLSMTLGGGEVKLLELTSAYGSFANGGKRVEPVAILKVVDSSGKVMEEFKPVEGRRVLDERYAFLINSILSDNSARELVFGLRSLLNISGRSIAVKTGTTNDRRDNWTVGWGNRSRIVGVWVGNNDNSAMKEVASGVSGASPIWRKILLFSLEGIADEPFGIPPGMVTVDVDAMSGYRAHDGFPSRSELYVEGTEPTSDDPVHKKVKVCKASGKLATTVDISRGDFDEKEFFYFVEKDATGGKDGINLWQKGIDEWIATQTDSRYHPPADYCATNEEVSLEIREPADRSTITSAGGGAEVLIRAEAFTSASVSKMEFFVDGTSRAVFTSGPFEVRVFMPDGIHSIKAVFDDSRGKRAEREIIIGVNISWDATPTPLPTSPTPTPTVVVSPTP